MAGLVAWRVSSRERARRLRSPAHRSADANARTARAMPRGRYAAKVFRISNNPCRAALQMRDQSFLAAEAPPLPLAGCDRACYCHYTSHMDRRTRDDRRYPAADFVPGNELLLPDSAIEPEDARTGDERRRRLRNY